MKYIKYKDKEISEKQVSEAIEYLNNVMKHGEQGATDKISNALECVMCLRHIIQTHPDVEKLMDGALQRRFIPNTR